MQVGQLTLMPMASFKAARAMPRPVSALMRCTWVSVRSTSAQHVVADGSASAEEVVDVAQVGLGAAHRFFRDQPQGPGPQQVEVGHGHVDLGRLQGPLVLQRGDLRRERCLTIAPLPPAEIVDQPLQGQLGHLVQVGLLAERGHADRSCRRLGRKGERRRAAGDGPVLGQRRGQEVGERHLLAGVGLIDAGAHQLHPGIDLSGKLERAARLAARAKALRREARPGRRGHRVKTTGSAD